MTKYKELCEAYKEDRQKYVEYRDACMAMASTFITSFSAYLGAPSEDQAVRLVPSDEFDDQRFYEMGEIFADLPNNGYWDFRIAITLFYGDSYKNFLIPTRLSKNDDLFLIALGHIPPPFKFHSNNDKELTTIFEFIYTELKDCCENGLDHLLTGSSRHKELGLTISY